LYVKSGKIPTNRSYFSISNRQKPLSLI